MSEVLANVNDKRHLEGSLQFVSLRQILRGSETTVSVRQIVRQSFLRASKARRLRGVSVETDVPKGFSVSLSHTPLIGGETETETTKLLWGPTARLVTHHKQKTARENEHR